VVVQKQVIETIEELQQQLGAAVILIGHDMGLMAQFAERIAVMYAGRLVEVGSLRMSSAVPCTPTRNYLAAACRSWMTKVASGHSWHYTLPA